ncbi:hypothetical protein [Vibrio sagamiensis]|uniref:Uncharacterized protein n=1 Tax=Vibrio sagamiensis NBRC 104589 TaxID=1219064 RepID=A0A511QFX4_9VIBR|nr:hypothetical protein [Vibrio sagamiensis]GEM76214.1 hypothetical protein VSA01S_23260 [Vibrio sagamiensis NBRC 104589]
MATATQANISAEYEIRYFEQGQIIVIKVLANNKQEAHQYYLDSGKTNNNLYSIRPDK